MKRYRQKKKKKSLSSREARSAWLCGVIDFCARYSGEVAVAVESSGFIVVYCRAEADGKFRSRFATDAGLLLNGPGNAFASVGVWATRAVAAGLGAVPALQTDAGCRLQTPEFSLHDTFNAPEFKMIRARNFTFSAFISLSFGAARKACAVRPRCFCFKTKPWTKPKRADHYDVVSARRAAREKE